ncbi:glycosyltransferase, partial [Zunongwangia profunda]|uniref:glycosyltransferase n=1 Tax=Zunongwangia profunda TaxID=398743 RepID=UPI0030DC92F3
MESILYGLSDDYIGLKYNEFSINNKIKFLFVGQYVERKGILDLMQIFKNLNYLKDKFELTFIVNDGSIDNVTQDFSFLGASLKVYGWMEREKLVDFYNNSHIFLMPSYGEGFGKTTTEAMAC